MRQSQAEIKAIEAELRSIRAEKTPPPGSSVTLLDPTAKPGDRTIQRVVQPISPTITRPTSAQTGITNRAKVANQSGQKRSIECFPFPTSSRQSNSRPTHPTALVDQLRQTAFESPDPVDQPMASSSAQGQQQRSLIRQLLEERAQQINQLSMQQETVILELMQISEQVEQNRQRSRSNRRYFPEPVCEYLSTEVPHVERDTNGTLVLTTRSIDWFEPEEASAALRYPCRQHRRSGLFAIAQWIGRTLWQLTTGLTGGFIRAIGAVGFLISAPVKLLFGQATTLPHRKQYRGSGRRAAAESPFTLRSAITLVLGAALLRVSLDWLVAIYPVLWIPSIVVMVAPALLAVYRATVRPQTGFVWGYRLFSIMIGLLIGGRL